MKRRSFFKSIAAVFGAVAALPAAIFAGKATAPVAAAVTKKSLSGYFTINGIDCFVNPDGSVAKLDRESFEFANAARLPGASAEDYDQYYAYYSKSFHVPSRVKPQPFIDDYERWQYRSRD